MNRRYARRGRWAGTLAAAVLGVSGALFTLGTPPAGASQREISFIGPFTTYQLMHALFPTSVNDLLPGGTTADQTIVSTFISCASGVTFSAVTLTGAKGVPNGSTAAKRYLSAEESASFTERGCVTFIGSTVAPSLTTSDANLDYYAYALDGVAPMVGVAAGGSVLIPVTISLGQMKEIYSCWNGTSVVTTWHEVGLGTSTATINRFWPEQGSGDRVMYEDMLGFTPAVTGGTNHCSTGAVTKFSTVTVTGTKKSVGIEEDTEAGLVYATKVKHVTIENDVFIYSSAKFVTQWNDPNEYNASTAYNRVNQRDIGNFTPTKVELASIRERKTTGATTSSLPGMKFVRFTFTALNGRNVGTTSILAIVTTTTVTESNEWYSNIPAKKATNLSASTTRVPGVRYVYNICDIALPGYNVCKMMVGFDNQFVTPTPPLTPAKVVTGGDGTKNRLCSGEYTYMIKAQGFVPLDAAGGPGTSNLDGATCREFPAKYLPGLAPPASYAKFDYVFETWVSPTQ